MNPSSPLGKPKDRNERGETALHICAKKGDLEGAKKLLEQSVDPNTTDFAGECSAAAMDGNFQFQNYFSILGWTPLHEASNHGHHHLAQLLIKHGANINAAGPDDITPLHDAAICGSQKLVKLLIDKGADVNFKNKKGKTAQEIAHPSLGHFFSTLNSGKFCSTSMAP